MPPSDPILDALLAQARAGDQPALGRLLELYRNYLRLLARSLIRQPLQVRLDASDLVQETFLKASREFAQFAGSGEKELAAWLRQILVRTLANQAKHHHARGATSAARNRWTRFWIARAWSFRNNSPTRSPHPARSPSGASRLCSWLTPWLVCLPTTERSSSCVTWSKSRSTRSPRAWAARPTPCAIYGGGR